MKISWDNKEEVLNAVEETAHILIFAPPELFTKEFFIEACKRNEDAYLFVPFDFLEKDEDYALWLVELSPKTLNYLAEIYPISPEKCQQYIDFSYGKNSLENVLEITDLEDEFSLGVLRSCGKYRCDKLFEEHCKEEGINMDSDLCREKYDELLDSFFNIIDEERSKQKKDNFKH